MKTRVYLEEMVPMRDGTKLYTAILLPEKGKKFPVAILRNPYFRAEDEVTSYGNLASDEYALVVQHCRGTGRSEGDCIPYLNEHNDGLDLLDWIRQQDFYDGEIYVFGSSYCSSVHLSYLKTNPPDVKAAALYVQDSNRYNILYRNGFLKTGLHGNWSLMMYKKSYFEKHGGRQYVPSEVFRTLPLAGISKYIYGEINELFEEEIRHPDPADPFWQSQPGGSEYAHAVRDCRIPVLLTTAFYDIYTGGVLDMWDELPDDRRNECALIVSPHAHGWSAATNPDLPEFPNSNVDEYCPGISYVWFDHIRKGTPLKFIQKGKVVYYSLFENQWRSEEHLLDGKNELKFYLNPGKVLEKTPGKKEEISYLHNPFSPASFKGGCCLNFDGMAYQDRPDSRYDIRSFLTEPFEEDVLFKGKGELTLRVRSTAPDTCFYARLSIVREDGTLCLRDDIDSICRTVPDYVPGEETTLHFHLISHCYLLKKGERLRLDISSSCFPYFLTHTNRKGAMVEQTGADLAENTVFTGESFLTLYSEPQG